MSQLPLLGSVTTEARGPGLRDLPAVGRIDRDAYYTPDALAAVCVAAVHAVEPITGIVWEPHVGGGAWARALLQQTEASLWLSDVDPGAAGLYLLHSTSTPLRVACTWHKSFLDTPTCSSMPGRRADWIIGNPPYSDAEAHVRHALDCTRRHVVMLLRLAYVESAGRIPFWQAHPCRRVWALAQRPSFTSCGRTDSAAYGLFWWDREWRGDTSLIAGWDWQQSRGAA